MDVALKQRLVGASVLVIFSVTFIPMLLDGPPSSPVEAPIAIPQQPDARFETRLLPVGQDANGQSQRPAAQSVPGTQAPATRRPSTSTSQDRPVVAEPEIRAKPLATAGNQTPPPITLKPAAQTAKPPAPAASSGSQGPWVLQLGSFGNAANAARLVERLQAGQWKAYQEKVEVGSNSLYRVRVSGWPQKDAALDAGEKLLKAFPDLELSVRETTSAASVANGSPAPLQGWMVQMGSFNSRENALALRDKLRGGGFSAHLSDAGAGADARYRVRVGPELDEASAKATREKIRQKLALSGLVIDHP